MAALIALSAAAALGEPGFGFGTRHFRWLASAAILMFLAPNNQSKAFVPVSCLLGAAALILAEGPHYSTLSLLLLPSLAYLAACLASSRAAKALVVLGLFAFLSRIRFHQAGAFLGWWFASAWLKVLTLTLADRRYLSWSVPGLARANFFFFAPPFLLGAAPLEWVTYDYFRENMERRSATTRRSVRLLALAIVLLAAGRFWIKPFADQLAITLDVFSPSATWLHQAAWGYCLFLDRVFALAGGTSLVIGLFGLQGVELRLDFDFPFLARDFLDFWSRYHSYGREFLSSHVFLPLTFWMHRLIPVALGIPLGVAAVFSVVAIVQHMNFVPGSFATIKSFYSLRGCAQHETAAFAFFWATLAFRRGADSFAGKRRALWAPWLGSVASWAVTQILVGYLFYGAYWNLWRASSLSEYFARMLRL